MESYARHFDLLKNLVFDAKVQKATRTGDDTKWRLDMLINGECSFQDFDKVVFCHGYQTKPEMPHFEGEELFEGKLLHSQQFRRSVPNLYLELTVKAESNQC